MSSNKKSGNGFAIIAVVYLLGLLLGGLYVGIVAPLRTVVQTDFGIDSSLGIWMINAYTLFYAATIPVTGNLADRYGKKTLFVACLTLFTVGALICGLSQYFGGFALLLVGRVIQAAGAGGVMPVATAAMGTSAPEGKQGMWLGIAAAVAGIANTLGSAAGSFVCGIVGVEGWSWAFFIAVPIGILLILAGLMVLPKDETEVAGKLDMPGAFVFVIFVLCLLLGVKGIDFANIGTSIIYPMTWIPLLIAVAILPLFKSIEKRAADPVFDLEYLANSRIVIIMAVSFFVGCSIISMTLVPEFTEYAMGIPVGSGGYYMALIGVFAIAGPPMCGKIIDKHGAKKVLLAGLAVTAAGYAFLAFVVAPNPNNLLLILGLAVVGFGMGFTMGTPLNYMILQNTSPEKSSTAIATVSLVRQMGTTLAPAILVGFTTAGLGLDGYCMMLTAVAVFNVISIVLLLPYKE